MRVYSEVYGCASNQADQEISLGLLRQAGFAIVAEKEKADLLLIFTCCVKKPTEQRMVHRIKALSKLDKPLIIAGCMPKVQAELLTDLNPKASLLGPNSILKVVEVAKLTLAGKRVVLIQDFKEPRICLPRVRLNPVIGIVPISQGCAWRKCAYCIVRFARGKHVSYPKELIVKDVQQALSQGCKEIWLTAQDTASYGSELGSNLAELIKEISKLQGKFWIRVGMMNPLHAKLIVDELLEAYESPKVFKFLHLPIQSGSNKVLKLMGRGYKVRDCLTIIRKFRKRFPYFTLWTDIIVGFPGEKRKDFEKSLKLVQKVEFDRVNVSKFGTRPLIEVKEELDPSIVKERVKKLESICREISWERNKLWDGWEGLCLIDEVMEKGLAARNFAYKLIHLSKGKLGDFVKVKVKFHQGKLISI